MPRLRRGRRQVIDLNANDSAEYGPLWVVTNDRLDQEQDWLAEICNGTQADADWDASMYNAWPDLLDHIRHLHALQTFIRVMTAAVEDGEMTADAFYQSIVHATPEEIDEVYQIIQHAKRSQP